MLGLRGFVEIHMYRPGDEAPKAIEDLAYLADKAKGVAETKNS